MSKTQGDPPDIDNLCERLRKLESRSPGTLLLVERFMEYLEAAHARGESVQKIHEFFDFCCREPDIAVLIALLGGVLGRARPLGELTGQSREKGGSLSN